MPRIQAIDPQTATGKAKELLDGVQAKMGRTPNIMRTMASSPAVLEAYLGLSGALGAGSLSAQVREQIALTVAEANGCDYCLSAHAAIGKMTGLTDDQIADSRQASAADPKTAALLRFVHIFVDQKGRVSDAEVEALRVQGFGDGELAEIVANISANIFTNYFNHLAETEVDFPAVPALQLA